VLHLLSQSPIEAAVLERVDSGDVVVFLENAALRILQNGNVNHPLLQQLGRSRLCVLSDDLAVRGINSNELIEGIEVIDYAELVELTINNPIIQSWM
jgi:tRNA 2-thiouridine synthesizing protein B